MQLPDPPRSTAWPEVQRWRTEVRRLLIARRMALEPGTRALRAEAVKENLRTRIDLARYAVLGIYWPVRGEIDVRDLGRAHLDAGGRVALPAVTEKAAPVEFRCWRPEAPLGRDACGIPVPTQRELLTPDALIVPLVGFDAQCYRLGYGGGYYDRTLAAQPRRPLCIGLGFQDAQLRSIVPQPHDIPMSLIVTDAEDGAGRGGGGAAAPPSA